MNKDCENCFYLVEGAEVSDPDFCVFNGKVLASQERCEFHSDNEEYDPSVKLAEIISEYFEVGKNCYTYNLTRDKAAFGIGTMSLEDFDEVDEEFCRDLAEYIVRNFL